MIMSHVADNYGRKKGEYISWGVCIAGQIILLLSFNVFMVGVGSFFMGFGANGAITIHYSFFKELVLGKTRERMIIAIQLAFSIGISIVSLLSYFFDQWKYTLGFFILLPSIFALLIFHRVEETP
jgi:MFS family permease